MCRKTTAVLSRIVLISFVMLLNMASISSAVITWSNGGADGDWSNTANWIGGVLPNTSSDYAQINMAAGPVFSTGRTATAYRISLGGTNGTLTVSGGSLTANNHIYVATLAADTATLNMSGGAINIVATLYIARDSGSNGTVNLSGGTITCGILSMRYMGGTGTINITGTGKLIIANDVRTTINTYINNGWIKAYNGAGTVAYDFNVTTPGKTTLWVNIKAANPSPANNAVDVAPIVNLSWTAGSGAISHNVYFGTVSPGEPRGNQTATTFDPGALDFDTTYYWRIDEVTGSGTITGDVWTFTIVSGRAKTPNPVNGAMNTAMDKVLSWVAGYGAVSHDVYLGTVSDDVNAAGRLTGDLNGDGIVNWNDISRLMAYWLADPAGSEPYAGVNDDNIVDFNDYALLANNWMVQGSPLFRGNTSNTSYDDPCNFGMSTTYYWRIDEINGSETIKGDVWRFTTLSTDSNYTLVGKIMCGYQGWFNTPTDGAGRGWVHWGPGNFSPNSCTVDMWPDMTEYGTSEKFLASAFYDGEDHYVFSSYKRDTVLRHFQWMQDYGIDGVYLQRFGTEVFPGSLPFLHRNAVLSHCKEGANLYGKKYAVMYDLSNLPLGGTQSVIDDWKYLVDTMHVGRDPCDYGYIKHKGKPVVAVWGIGWTDRAYTWEECLALVTFLKDDPTYGGNTVMIGVKSNWRSKYLVSSPSQTMLDICTKADIISPWSIGGYRTTTEVNTYATKNWVPDKSWCNSHGKDYLPVIWPGYSFHNADPVNKVINEKPRRGGQLLWDQVKSVISTVGTNMIYVAMFDEVDEGTAVFKVTNNPPVSSGAEFVTYRQDLPSPDGGPGILPAGAELPSDEYLWLTGQAGRALRGEIPVNQTRPTRP